jgi:hypothetical protein
MTAEIREKYHPGGTELASGSHEGGVHLVFRSCSGEAMGLIRAGEGLLAQSAALAGVDAD